MRGLYQRTGSSLWWMSFTVDGRFMRRSTGTSDKKLAERIYYKIKGQIAEGKFFEVEEPDRTWNELCDKYEIWMKGRYKSDMKVHLVRQLRERFAGYKLPEVDLYEIEKFQSEKLRSGLKKTRVKGPDGKIILVDRPNKPATINRFMAVLAHMLQKAADWKMINRADLPKIKMLKEENKRLRYLSREQSYELIAACDGHLRPIVVTALNTGMRLGEILGLSWDRIDLKHGFILLDVTKSGKRREIPINSTLRALLESMVRRLDTPYVFVNPETGTRWRDVGRAFDAALRRAKILDFRFHDLRHTFASQLVMAGVDLVTVKELLGHAEIKMTLRYAHLAPAHKVKAMEVYDQVMNAKNRSLSGSKGVELHTFCTVPEKMANLASGSC